MQKFANSEDRRCVFGRPNHAAILSTTPFVGLTATQQVFGDTDAVVLVNDEPKQWSNGVGSDFSAFDWCGYAWWTIEEGLPAEYEGWIRHNPPSLPERSAYWVVESGVQWGDLAGGADLDLWRWDGTRAEYVERYAVISY